MASEALRLAVIAWYALRLQLVSVGRFWDIPATIAIGASILTAVSAQYPIRVCLEFGGGVGKSLALRRRPIGCDAIVHKGYQIVCASVGYYVWAVHDPSARSVKACR